MTECWLVARWRTQRTCNSAAVRGDDNAKLNVSDKVDWHDMSTARAHANINAACTRCRYTTDRRQHQLRTNNFLEPWRTSARTHTKSSDKSSRPALESARLSTRTVQPYQHTATTKHECSPHCLAMSTCFDFIRTHAYTHGLVTRTRYN